MFRAAVADLKSHTDAGQPEPEADATVAGNAVWRELCVLLNVEDEAIVGAGRTEDALLLRLRADLDEESIKRVEKIVARKDAEKDEAIAERDETIAERDAEIAKLQALLAGRHGGSTAA